MKMSYDSSVLLAEIGTLNFEITNSLLSIGMNLMINSSYEEENYNNFIIEFENL